jgi:hypothetical protein
VFASATDSASVGGGGDRTERRPSITPGSSPMPRRLYACAPVVRSQAGSAFAAWSLRVAEVGTDQRAHIAERESSPPLTT